MGLFTTTDHEMAFRETGGVQATCPLFDGDGNAWGHLRFRGPKNTVFEEAPVYGERAYFTCPYGRLASEPVHGTAFTIEGTDYVAVGPGERSESGGKITVPLGDA